MVLQSWLEIIVTRVEYLEIKIYRLDGINTKNIIFAFELIFIILWLFLGPHATVLKIIGIVVIIAISQLAHVLLKAR
ncbi:hypothetical protein C5Z26_09305 [Lactobacillus sp. CBA3606]|nr:hypothetical protein C5Z26_09305 [Lactobacillus sp. CBA3606]